jgi:hypothetical protein
MSEFQALETLRNAGMAVDAMPEEQRGVLAQLSPDEVNTLISVRNRLQDAGGDVEGHLKAWPGIGFVFY